MLSRSHSAPEIPENREVMTEIDLKGTTALEIPEGMTIRKEDNNHVPDLDPEKELLLVLIPNKYGTSILIRMLISTDLSIRENLTGPKMTKQLKVVIHADEKAMTGISVSSE